MPYSENEELPGPVRAHLPSHAQDIYRAAFNRAWASYRNRSPQQREETCHRIAWAAVKHSYRKAGKDWVPIEGYEA